MATHAHTTSNTPGRRQAIPPVGGATDRRQAAAGAATILPFPKPAEKPLAELIEDMEPECLLFLAARLAAVAYETRESATDKQFINCCQAAHLAFGRILRLAGGAA